MKEIILNESLEHETIIDGIFNPKYFFNGHTGFEYPKIDKETILKQIEEVKL